MKSRLIFVGILIFQSLTSRADSDRLTKEYLRQAEQLRANIMQFQNVPPDCNGASQLALTQCKRFYQSLYDQPVIDFTVSFGYFDPALQSDGNRLDDRYHASALKELLKSGCKTGNAADRKFSVCGFSEDPDDATVLRKQISFPNEGPREVVLHIMYSSIDGSKDAREMKQSERAWQTFERALRKSAVVLYNGHSRGGGGPDFAPARRKSNGRIDYTWYEKNRPNVRRIVSILDSEQTKKPKLIGLFSCDSKKHFLKELKKHSPGTHFIMTSATSFQDEDFRGLVASLDSLLGRKCADAFKKAINSPLNRSKTKYLLESFSF